VRGEPIVCSLHDAYLGFMRTDMDYLVLGNYLFDKRLQKYSPTKALQNNFAPD
jgi:carbamoyltransferase